MADLKITQLDSVSVPADADLFETVQNVSSTPVNRKISWSVIKDFLTTFFNTLYLSLSGGDVDGDLTVSGDVGVGLSEPLFPLHVRHSGDPQLRLDYDSDSHVSFEVLSNGDFFITPTGGDTNIFGGLTLTGTPKTTVLVVDNPATSSPRNGASIDTGASTNASFILNLTSNNGATNAMWVGADGFVGIGNVAPTCKLDVSDDHIRIRSSKTPATSGASGNAGDIAWDSDYLYVCIATDTWVRSPLSSW